MAQEDTDARRRRRASRWGAEARVATAGDLGVGAGCQVLGVLPAAQPSVARWRGGPHLPALLADPGSSLAAGLAALGGVLERCCADQGIASVALTSVAGAEGKSTVCAGLALALARSGRKVLLVDADLRAPAIAGLFGLSRGAGLGDVLGGACSWRQAARVAVGVEASSAVPAAGADRPQGGRLDLIAGGTIPADPAETLGSASMGQLLSAATDAYDMVIVDAPAVLQHTDALVVGRQVGGAVLVCRVGSASVAALRLAAQLVRGARICLLGAVLNGADNASAGPGAARGRASAAAGGPAAGRRNRAALGALALFVAGMAWQSGVLRGGAPGGSAASVSSAPSAPGADAVWQQTAVPAAPAGLTGLRPAPYAVRVALYATDSPWAARWLQSLRAARQPAFLAPVRTADRTRVSLLLGGFATPEEARTRGDSLWRAGAIEHYAVVAVPYALAWRPDQTAHRGDPGVAPYLYELPGADGGQRLLAGAFATEAEARGFVDWLGGAGSGAAPVRR